MSDRIGELDRALWADEMFWSQCNEEDHVHAVVVAEAFGPHDWQALDAVWRRRPVAWQRCLATVLTEVAPAEAVPWLLEMIEHGAEALALHAIDELRAMQLGRSQVLSWPAPAIARVGDLWRRHTGFTPRQVDAFLDDLARGRWW